MQRQLANPYTALQGSSKFGLLLALALTVGAGIVIFLNAARICPAPMVEPAIPMVIVARIAESL